ncbi:MAG TPA: efflux RND transporter periplasmic adaptor subunit [Candidatus Polarisedimenticolia bacterium]|nr:efflux RND transporter periplasmic adaptor subunit [Candidatus Polarisedimenticolia bacterium]
MLKRMLIMLAIVVGLLGLIGYYKYSQITTAMAAGAAFKPPPEAVTTVVAGAADWDQTLSAIGSVTPVQGVTVSADLPGQVQAIAFESGRSVKAGQVLVQLDISQEKAQLASAEAKRELTRLDLVRSQGLRDEKVVSQADLDAAQAASLQAEAAIAEIKATIGRKTIRAPFSGVLGIRQVNLGQYLNAGDPIVPLQSYDPIYVNFNVPQRELGRVNSKSDVHITSEGMDGEILGTVNAVDSVVDQATRNVQVQALVRNPDRKLKAGMFVKVEVRLPQRTSLVPLPSSSILYAPYGDSVFIVEEMTSKDGQKYKGVRQQVVKLGPSRGDQVGVLDGVKPGEEVVTSGVFKLRNGAAVLVNNDVQPSNSANPKPEES